MALDKHSKFYYGFKVDDTNNVIEFADSSGVHKGELTQGTYTLASLVAEVNRVFNLVGGQVYTFSVSRSDRTSTISAPGVFDLLAYTGSFSHVSAFSLLGFSTDADATGDSEYVGDTGCGKEFRPQFPLQSYLPTRANSWAIDAVRKKTATGIVEAVSFGRSRMMECELLFITDIPQPDNFIIRNNPNGEADAQEFLTYATSLGEVEFMEDESSADSFEVFILEATEDDPNGMGFRLKEEYDQNLPGYFRTGILKWNLRS